MKPCVKCGSTERIKSGDCKKCNLARVKAWALAHPEHKKKLMKKAIGKYRKAHPEKRTEEARRYRVKHPEKVQERIKRFQIKKEASFVLQAGRPRADSCEICGVFGKTVFDHDHATGLFRGWICHKCNMILGAVFDNSETLKKMARYLEKTNGI